MIKANVDPRKVIRLLNDFPEDAALLTDKFLDKQARVLISSSGSIPGLVQVTPPFRANKRGNDAKNLGRARIAGDIKRVFASASYAYKMIAARDPEMADAFWYFLKRKDFSTAQKILADFSSNVRIKNAQIANKPDQQLHESLRSRRTGRIAKNQNVLQIIANEGSLNAYLKKRQRKVGFLASAIPTAVGNRFGPLKGVPSWVTSQKSSYGYLYQKRNRKSRMIRIGIASKRAGSDLQARFTKVLQYRIEAIARELPYLKRAMERALRLKLKSAKA